MSSARVSPRGTQGCPGGRQSPQDLAGVDRLHGWSGTLWDVADAGGVRREPLRQHTHKEKDKSLSAVPKRTKTDTEPRNELHQDDAEVIRTENSRAMGQPIITPGL